MPDTSKSFADWIRDGLRIRKPELISGTGIWPDRRGPPLSCCSIDPDEVYAFLEARNAEGRNVYVCLNPVRVAHPAWKRATAATIIEVRTLLVDCDPDPTDDPADGVADAAVLARRVEEKLDRAGIAWTTTFSGRGHQVLVQLEALAADRTRDVLRWLEPLASGLRAHVDVMTHDSPRLVRAPGWRHQGSGARAAVVRRSGPAVVGAWTAVVAQLPLPEVSTRPRGQPREIRPLRGTTPKLLRGLRRLVEGAAQPTTGPERQAARAALVGHMVRHGMDDGSIRHVLRHESADGLIRSTRAAIASGRQATGAPTLARVYGRAFLAAWSRELATALSTEGLADFVAEVPRMTVRGSAAAKAAARASSNKQLRRWGWCGVLINRGIAAEIERRVLFEHRIVCDCYACATCWGRYCQGFAEVLRGWLDPGDHEVLWLPRAKTHLASHRYMPRGVARMAAPNGDGTFSILLRISRYDANGLAYFRGMTAHFKEAGCEWLKLSREELIRRATQLRLQLHLFVAGAEDPVAALEALEGKRMIGNPRVEEGQDKRGLARWPTRDDVREERAEIERAAAGPDAEPAEQPAEYELVRDADGEVLDRGPFPYGIDSAAEIAIRHALGAHRVRPSAGWRRILPHQRN